MDIPDSGGETQRKIFEAVKEQTGGEIIPPELEVEKHAPYVFRRVIDIFFKLTALRTELKPLQPSLIQTWLQQYGFVLTPYELDALYAIDRAFIKEMYKGNKL